MRSVRVLFVMAALNAGGTIGGIIDREEGVVAQTPSAAPAAESARAWERIIDAEDARAARPAQLRALLDGTRSADAALRAIAVRALGRLQRFDLTDSISPLLADRDPAVRANAAAALALANIVTSPSLPPAHAAATARARAALRTMLDRERDDAARGAAAEAIGRLRMTDAAATRETAAVLARMMDAARTEARRAVDAGVSPASASGTLVGTARGLFFLSRQPVAVRAGIDTARGALVRLAVDPLDDARIRTPFQRAQTVAAQTLAVAAPGDTALVRALLTHTHELVRREAVVLNGGVRDTAAFRTLNRIALEGRSWMVRYDALRQFGPRVLRDGSCAALVQFMRDPSAHVARAAIELAGGACTMDAATMAMLHATADSVAVPAVRHRASAALVALAARRPALRVASFAAHIAHPHPVARMHAATAARLLGDTESLRRLAGDRDVNVRNAAVDGLARTGGRMHDSIYLAQLVLDDSQLIMTASAALDSSRASGIADRALAALERVSRLRSETSRDGRVALMSLIRKHGSTAHASRMTAFLRDFDPAVADSAAAIIGAWTGSRPVAAPQPLPRAPLPSYDDAIAMQQSTFTLEMEDGTSYVIRLLPFDAPTNAFRFSRLARSGRMNGLTLHRIEPTFVIQGGSTGANEYAGDALFSRDELGIPNWAGTVGLSTRGHDTGDAQFYFNTIDNVRLDPSYTVFGMLSGAPITQSTPLEGATITAVRSIRSPGR